MRQPISTQDPLMLLHQAVSRHHGTIHLVYQSVSVITPVTLLQHQTVSTDHTVLRHMHQAVPPDHLDVYQHQAVSLDHQMMYLEHQLCQEFQTVSTLVAPPEVQMHQTTSMNHLVMSQEC